MLFLSPMLSLSSQSSIRYILINGSFGNVHFMSCSGDNWRILFDQFSVYPCTYSSQDRALYLALVRHLQWQKVEMIYADVNQKATTTAASKNSSKTPKTAFCSINYS